MNLECTYKHYSFIGLGKSYYCEVSTNINIISPETAFISSSSGSHLHWKNNDDVIAIIANDKNIKHFPKGLELIFKNLKAIDMEEGRIKELFQSDLKPLKNLVYLDLGKNDIEVLEDGIFDHNPHLTTISFYGNKIYHIGMNVFDNLGSLNYLVLELNRCIDMNAMFNVSGVKNIIQITKTRCQHSEFANKKIKDC